MTVLRSMMVGMLVAILITAIYIGMHLSQGSLIIVNVKDLFLGIGLMAASLGFSGILLRMRFGFLPMLLFGALLIVMFIVGLFLVSSNIG